MANQLTVLNVSPMFKQRRVRYGLILSGLYVQAVRGSNVGELIDLTKLVGKYDAQQFWGYTGPTFGAPTQPPAGYTASFLPGADGLRWLLKVFSAPGVELAAGAYPAAILADLDAYIEFWGGDFK